MDTAHLEANFTELLKDVNTARPKRAGKFITRVFITSPPSSEMFKVNPFLYVPEENIVTSKSKTEQLDEEEDDDPAKGEEQPLKAAN